MKTKALFNTVKLDKRLYTWFDSEERTARAGFSMLFDSVDVEFEEEDEDDVNTKAFQDTWNPGSAPVFEGSFPTSWKTHIVEVAPSCDAFLFNMAGGPGSTLEQNLGFYSMLFKKMDGQLFMNEHVTCVTDGRLETLISGHHAVMNVPGRSGTVMKRLSSGGHPVVC